MEQKQRSSRRDSKYRNGKDGVSEEISTQQAMITMMAKCFFFFLPTGSLGAKNMKEGSLTSDFSPVPATSQILIESINRGRGRESPDSGVKSAYVMTCSLAG